MVVLHHRPRILIATSHDVLLSMRFGLTRHLPLNRSLAYYSINSGTREQQLKSPVTMATKSETPVEISPEEIDKDKKSEEEVSLPPPPEKPEPGDCCGSGCVRCVWDVYYEELEEHKKLSGETKSN